jgi:hypothetical protein
VSLCVKQLNPHSCRSYLIADGESGRVALVDPVLEHFGVSPQWVLTGDALSLDEGGAGRDDPPGGNPAAQILRKAGFPQVSVLEGGMIAWRAEGR